VKRLLPDTSGFTLIESAFVMAIFGLLLGFSVPSFLSYRRSLMLQTSSQSLIGQIRLGQHRAIGLGNPQRLTFSTDDNSCAIQDLVTGETLAPYTLPRGISLESAGFVEGGETGSTLTALIDGRFSGSGDLVLRDTKGRRDTISVLTSGQATGQ